MRGRGGAGAVWRLAAALGLAATIAAALFAPSALGAEAPQKLWSSCPSGEAAGQCSIPRGIAAQPGLPGDIFVANQENLRIEELTAWGAPVKAWGWGVKDGSAELQTCTQATGCKEGLRGAGVGEFNGTQGIALDSSGDIYLVDRNNHRVQKFDPEGHFLAMFGGGVNETSGGNVCPRPGFPADVCKTAPATTGTGPGQFEEWAVGSFIATSPGPPERIYVGDTERVQVFEPNGTYVGDFPDPGEIIEKGGKVQALAADAAGDLYLDFEGKANVVKLNPGGSEVCTMAVAQPQAIATDGSGNVYVANHVSGIPGFTEVLGFNSTCGRSEVPGFGGDELSTSTGLAVGGACLSAGSDLYVSNANQADSFVSSYGPPPDEPACPPPPGPPEIDAQYALSVDPEGAVLGAEINPHFFSGPQGTTYFAQYATAACIEAGGWGAGCVKERPDPPGAKLPGGVVDEDVSTPGVSVSGLAPGTEYRFRFVAEAEGEEVIGVGGKPGLEGEDAGFQTPPLPPPAKEDCPNQALRTGPSAQLPDCRAYEMVSPLDKGNSDIKSQANPLDQSAEEGGKLAYTAVQAFGGALSAPFSSEYLARRGAGGWTSESLNPPREGFPLSGENLELFYKAFSADLCSGWLVQSTEPQLSAGAQPGYANPYRQDLCGGGGYEELLPVAPKQPEGERFNPEVQGHSADGARTVYRVKDELTGDAASGSNLQQLYEYHEGALALVSVLPGGAACAVGASAGTEGFPLPRGANHSVHNAVSADAQRIYFSCGPKLYLREVEAGETLPVSTGAAQFWTAAPDGSRAIFSEGETLYEFDAAEGTASPIATHFKGLLGASEDARRLYLASSEVLSGGEENSEGAKAQNGQPNLYLHEGGGGFRFVATLAAADIPADVGNVPSPLDKEPPLHTARVGPEGQSAAFMSSAELSGYDNTDANSGEADAEVYLYDASARGGAGELLCASCNPSGARPAGRNLVSEAHPLWAAARIPGSETSLYAPRNLSSDGNRLYFESFEALVPRDSDGTADVYQWERAADRAQCLGGEGGELFLAGTEAAGPGGCLSLISSGKSATDSAFVDASAEGKDVFFSTGASLLPQDPGLVDIYDARQQGGFPPPPPGPVRCEGTNCQSPAAAPEETTPASASFQGTGNAAPQKHKNKKHKKHKHQHKQKQKHKRRHGGGGR